MASTWHEKHDASVCFKALARIVWMPTHFKGRNGMTELASTKFGIAPEVSVVVPNYNHARYLRKRIESVLAQTYQDFELILLDDCSTDDSREVLSSYSDDFRVRIAFNEENSGSTFRQWNKGVRMARGKYIWIAESDDYADVHLLEKLTSRLTAEPDTVLCYCRSWRVSADDVPSGFLDSYLSSLDSKRWAHDFCSEGIKECQQYLVHCNTVLSASSVVFRKDAYWEAGGADESLVLGGDWKMWAALALAGGKVAYASEPLNYYRFHSESVSERTARNGVRANEALQVVNWILARLDVDEKTRRELCRELGQIWVPAVLDKAIPVGLRLAIFRNALALDNQAALRLFRPALVALGMTVRRRWHSLRNRLAVGERRATKRTW
jgi:GT2 family glycosyltransferase